MVSGEYSTMLDLQWESPLIERKIVGGAREAFSKPYQRRVLVSSCYIIYAQYCCLAAAALWVHRWCLW